ncbi:MAG: fibronectin type III domain-containing protein [Chloroflexi bacterium]|nr:fibronectin type III domain-containing protein [Chloroflexota bacterium]MBI2983999.1 fibronectin type III domain-containing protein [Chloroflexota bacterium]
MPLAFTASSVSPGNVLATLLLEPPPSLAATAMGDGTVDLQWDTSPSAAARDVEYLVLRRQIGATGFTQVARTAAVTYTDSPTPGTFEYVVRTAISSFWSADSPVATATTGP